MMATRGPAQEETDYTPSEARVQGPERNFSAISGLADQEVHCYAGLPMRGIEFEFVRQCLQEGKPTGAPAFCTPSIMLPSTETPTRTSRALLPELL